MLDIKTILCTRVECLAMLIAIHVHECILLSIRLARYFVHVPTVIFKLKHTSLVLNQVHTLDSLFSGGYVYQRWNVTLCNRHESLFIFNIFYSQSQI